MVMRVEALRIVNSWDIAIGVCGIIYIHIHSHAHTNMYIDMCGCVGVWVCVVVNMYAHHNDACRDPADCELVGYCDGYVWVYTYTNTHTRIYIYQMYIYIHTYT